MKKSRNLKLILVVSMFIFWVENCLSATASDTTKIKHVENHLGVGGIILFIIIFVAFVALFVFGLGLNKPWQQGPYDSDRDIPPPPIF